MTKFIHATGPVVKVSSGDIELFLTECGKDSDHKFRYCAHPGINDPIHEMIITHRIDTIVPIHRHLGKSESFHWIEGLADVMLYADGGKLIETIPMGPVDSGRVFYYRLNAEIYHTLKILSPVVVFHEVTNGPWHREDMIIAPFWTAPKGWSR